ncbi:MAG: UvrD-helicase domain-containing protein [Byssovorax sp.]
MVDEPQDMPPREAGDGPPRSPSAAPREGGAAGLGAIDATIFAFRRNVVVAASAGTGKTHRLTALYLLLTLGLTSMGQDDDRSAAPPVGPERIVATTFSRAAALEISLRIERALGELAAWDGASKLMFGPILEARQALLGALPPGELSRRAADALSRWPAAKIDTLHGVARRIVQRHALSIGLPPGARVLDEEEAQALGALAVDEALGAALTAGGERAETARALITSAGSVHGARIQALRLLDRLDEEGLTPRELAIADHAAEARGAARRLARIARESASFGSKGFQAPAAALADAIARIDSAGPEDAHHLDALTPLLVAFFAARFPRRDKRTTADDVLEQYLDELPGKNRSEKAHGVLALLRHGPSLAGREARLVALLEDARARFFAAKRRAGGLGFGDLLRIARDTLRDRPDLARAVREGIDVLLVDEFQDTSRVQRDLVYLLREHEDAALARPAGTSPSAAGLLGHGLFLVGDRKQSIYGFRGADVAVFSRVCVELAGRAASQALAMPDEGAAPDPIADFVALGESRRSGEKILRFVNAFSSRDFLGDRLPGEAPRDFEIAYGPAEHLSPALPASAGEVVLVTDDGASPAGVDPIVRESSGPAREAHLAAAYVAGVVGGRLSSKQTSYRDCAVLARRRSTIPLVELALGRLSIPYVVAGRALYDAAEVRDIAALLRLLLDPRDRQALATVVRGPMVGLGDTSLARLSLPDKGLTIPLFGRWPSARSGEKGEPMVDPSQLDPAERTRLDAFRARFAELRGAVLRLPPGEAIRAALQAFDLDRILAALPRAEARIGNVDRLVGIARRRGGTLSGFVRWLDRRIRDEADEAEAAVFSAEDDAVRLTTIHASKGLDFPVVILVDLNAQPRSDHGALGFLAQSSGRAPTLVVRHYAPRPDLGPGEGPLVSIVTPTLEAAQAEARAREEAERRRLTYVAITRPQHTLVLIGSPADPRPGSALRSLGAGLDQGELGGVLSTLDARDLLDLGRPPPAPILAVTPPEIRAPSRPTRSPARTLRVGAEALSLFADCPRRFRLRHLLGLEEPPPGEGEEPESPEALAAEEDDRAPPTPIDDLPLPVSITPDLAPLVRGRAAHRVIARWPLRALGDPPDIASVRRRLLAEGLGPDHDLRAVGEMVAELLRSDFARSLRDADDLRRDAPYVLPVETGARGVRVLELSGAVDLLVHRGEVVEVIDLVLASPRADLAPYERRLRAAALAAHRLHAEAKVRAGLLFLGGEPLPIWLEGQGPEDTLSREEHAHFEAELAALAQRFAEARYHDRFDLVPPARCAALGCGFLAACHGPRITAR